MTLLIDSIASALGEERVVAPPKYYSNFLGKAESGLANEAKLVSQWAERKTSVVIDNIANLIG